MTMSPFILIFRSVLLIGLLIGAGAPAEAHEGHDHDKPPPLALPVAPRVVAITPDFELVGVASGKQRLTIFLHSFATNEPIKGASISVSAGEESTDAKAEGDGVFSVVAPWLEADGDVELVFGLKLADGTEDLLTGTLKRVEAQTTTAASQSPEWGLASLLGRIDFLLAGGIGLVAGILLTLFFGGGRSSSKLAVEADEPQAFTSEGAHKGDQAEVRPLRRSASAIALMLVAAAVCQPDRAQAADAAVAPLPSVPSTMATDLAQRMPDGSLFVPKATQHLLSIRTVLTAESEASVAAELTGTIIAGPGRFGRVQPGVPRRIEAATEGLAYVGKRVSKGDALASSRPTSRPRIGPTSKVRSPRRKPGSRRTRPSCHATRRCRVQYPRSGWTKCAESSKRKLAELQPSTSRRESVLAPISGVVSLAKATVGQIVEARDVLFEIIDPSELWVEAVSYASGAAQDFTAAFVVTKGGEQIQLVFMGRGAALREQAAVLTFKIEGDAARLAVGTPVKVVVQSSADVKGFVLPSSAVVRGQTGLPTIWIKTDAERFEPQVVKTAPLDGSSIVVTAGLKADKRVVTDGVTLLNQVR
jgi:biotin carboxyl carrier protein